MAKVEKTLSGDTNTINEKAPKKDKKDKSKKAVKNREPKRSRTRETISELKKVSWPSFGKTMKQTGMVISVVVIFMLLVLGFDTLFSELIKLLGKI